MFQGFFKDELGATAIEYSLIAAFVAVIAIPAFRAFGVEMADMYDHVATIVQDTID